MPEARPSAGGRKAPTIIDVARMAGVSKTVASDALRGHPHVSDEKRDAVRAAATEFGYRPNAAARALVSQRSRTLGVLVSDLHNPFFAEVVEGVAEVAERMQMSTIVVTGFMDPDREARVLESMLEGRSDGLILVSPVVGPSVLSTVATNQPTVVLAPEPDVVQADTVQVDEELGALLAVEHLASLGHTRIAHADGGRGAGAQARAQHYAEAMRGLGLTPEVYSGGFTEAAGAQAAREILETSPRPTGLLMANDLAAIGALGTIASAGFDVPIDMSVVGFDNTDLAASDIVSLTTIDQPRAEMGRVAVAMITERLLGHRTHPRSVTLKPSLVVRRTTGNASRAH